MGSVNKAREALEKPDETASEIFYQAADIYSKTKDYFNGYGGVTFDYRNGYAYKHYAGLSNAELKKEGLDMGKFFPVSIIGWALARVWKSKFGIV